MPGSGGAHGGDGTPNYCSTNIVAYPKVQGGAAYGSASLPSAYVAVVFVCVCVHVRASASSTTPAMTFLPNTYVITHFHGAQVWVGRPERLLLQLRGRRGWQGRCWRRFHQACGS